ncbi:MAG: protein-glutamate O-methyltransferase CheR [Methanosarcinaceae archaeon]|nr:protein-glutamate O-methyltransferase CheR [Methanosarcinaceae archaeon]MDD4496565.1 protein-glutamate O-methyltransferase CheR [Methanosarcinaceae archaeon]
MNDDAYDELSFMQLKKYIKESTGFNCDQYKDAHFRRRIKVRMRLTNSNNYSEYIHVLEEERTEQKNLIDTLTINVTDFFRNHETFRIIEEEILPTLIKSRSSSLFKTIRIWSAGCAAGEEAYSIAILLHKLLKNDVGKYRINIIGTDLDVISLKKARKGIYNEIEMRNVDKKTRECYFQKMGDSYQVIDELKDLIHFKQHDMLSGPKISYFDMIICRNVMIYFKKEIQEQLYLDFYQALNNGGFFIIGKSETMTGPAAGYFTPYNTRERLYVKKIPGNKHDKTNQRVK